MNSKHPHRLFTIGCSFTKYKWKTWADHLGEYYTEYYNFGRPGAGNKYIMTELTEKILQYDINSNDRVAICWSSMTREDRYLRLYDTEVLDWVCQGNLLNANVSERPKSLFKKEWVRKYFTMEHAMKTNYAMIYNVYHMLKQKQIPFAMLCMVDLKYAHTTKDMIRLSFEYGDILDEIYPSIKRLVFHNKWPGGKHTPEKGGQNQHPSEKQAYDYTHTHLTNLIHNQWPL
tara:strand:- start:882 stop:1571 length:690 start_codon:yes stop_codon:yes gene_type:complete